MGISKVHREIRNEHSNTDCTTCVATFMMATGEYEVWKLIDSEQTALQHNDKQIAQSADRILQQINNLLLLLGICSFHDSHMETEKSAQQHNEQKKANEIIFKYRTV